MTEFISAMLAAAVILAMAVIAILFAGLSLVATIGLAVCLAGLLAGLWQSLRPRRSRGPGPGHPAARALAGSLPGPMDVQASRWPDEDTGISDEEFQRQLRQWLSEGGSRG